MHYVFGPVQSRRLGLSLGIDPIQDKTCTLDCVYCQLGATATKTLKRRVYARTCEVLNELRPIIAAGRPIDYITFSGTGEPTLNSELGRMISEIKTITDVPVAVITNSTLLHLNDVRADLMQADLVVPSVNAVSPQVFTRISRAHAGVDLARMLQGLETFSHAYKGQLWVEVMLVQGINDGPYELQALAQFLGRLACEKIQINTVTRPPAEKGCTAASDNVLESARQLFGPRAEIISSPARVTGQTAAEDPQERILTLVRSHPCTLEQICGALGMSCAQVEAVLQDMVSQQTVARAEHDSKIFYRASGR